MAIHPELLDILVCPITKVPVKMLDEDKLAELNRNILAGKVSQSDGERLTTGLSAALITDDGKTIYKVEDDIPIMLAEESIATEGLGLGL